MLHHVATIFSFYIGLTTNHHCQHFDKVKRKKTFLTGAIRFFESLKVGIHWFCMKKYCSLWSHTHTCKICHIFTQSSENWQWPANESMVVLGQEVLSPICTPLQKYEVAGFNLDQLINGTITSECRQVFSCHLREASRYECIHADFPVTTFQVAESDFLVTEKGEAPFDSEEVVQ